MENMDNERDILVLNDEDGNEIQLEVLRYFFYNGEEYAMVTELDGEEGCACGHDHHHDHDHDHGDDCECGGIEVFFMKVDPVDDENEEYSFVDEKLSEELIRVIESSMDEDDEDFEDDSEEE